MQIALDRSFPNQLAYKYRQEETAEFTILFTRNFKSSDPKELEMHCAGDLAPNDTQVIIDKIRNQM
eukprot:NODE_5850_length_547_cov_65.556225_g5105_i0.p2 GENE.NODE_5850_length_547_cov_65.556225_g5105_i0~~NODE_5850_length_547_cov_65.556225_g5105_i0.p2  ORF type:complete len:66 (+),score=16.46 NODE_5850_length_547_cov_65.556225_g5105_i0:183-380(+)